jgi:pyruvate/2-oxoglutarate dehydrogenase complex dihydrolipoamide acyltransferase (E2) component
MMARVRVDGERVEELRSPLPGRIDKAFASEGRQVSAGDEMFVLAPDEEHVRDALIGLYYFGAAEDLPEIERYAAGVEGMSEEVKKQAAATAEAVRRRASQGS